MRPLTRTANGGRGFLSDNSRCCKCLRNTNILNLLNGKAQQLSLEFLNVVICYVAIFSDALPGQLSGLVLDINWQHPSTFAKLIKAVRPERVPPTDKYVISPEIHPTDSVNYHSCRRHRLHGKLSSDCRTGRFNRYTSADTNARHTSN